MRWLSRYCRWPYCKQHQAISTPPTSLLPGPHQKHVTKPCTLFGRWSSPPHPPPWMLCRTSQSKVRASTCSGSRKTETMRHVLGYPPWWEGWNSMNQPLIWLLYRQSVWPIAASSGPASQHGQRWIACKAFHMRSWWLKLVSIESETQLLPNGPSGVSVAWHG